MVSLVTEFYSYYDKILLPGTNHLGWVEHDMFPRLERSMGMKKASQTLVGSFLQCKKCKQKPFTPLNSYSPSCLLQTAVTHALFFLCTHVHPTLQILTVPSIWSRLKCSAICLKRSPHNINIIYLGDCIWCPQFGPPSPKCKAEPFDTVFSIPIRYWYFPGLKSRYRYDTDTIQVWSFDTDTDTDTMKLWNSIPILILILRQKGLIPALIPIFW